jgi:hypothetical protein
VFFSGHGDAIRTCPHCRAPVGVIGTVAVPLIRDGEEVEHEVANAMIAGDSTIATTQTDLAGGKL